MSERLLHVLREYKISNSIGYFIADNVSSNDRAIELLSDHLQIESNKQRLRCAAHIINLVCKAILLGIDDDCIEDALPGNDDVLEDGNDEIDQSIQRFEGSLRDEKAALAAWRKKGPVGKLHNLVIHIKESSARRQYFESKQKEVDPELPVYRVVVNGGVRWNSTHDMIDRALQLKDALELYQSAYRYDRDHPTNLDELTPDDWLELRELRDLLEPMKIVSTQIQSNPAYGGQGALWQNLSSLDFLIDHLERQRQLLSVLPNTHFKACVNLGWKKLDKYYTLTDRTHAYRAAIFLNPCLRAEWFDEKWASVHPTWITEMNNTMRQLYKTYERLYPDEQAVISTFGRTRELNDFEKYNRVGSSNNRSSELERYKHETLLEEDCDIIQWWRDNRRRYPILSRIAFDLLAAPATSAADERAFSEADDTINYERPRLHEDTAEATQCLRSWILSDLVDLWSVSVQFVYMLDISLYD
jgi:hypothetical protein